MLASSEEPPKKKLNGAKTGAGDGGTGPGVAVGGCGGPPSIVHENDANDGACAAGGTTGGSGSNDGEGADGVTVDEDDGAEDD